MAWFIWITTAILIAGTVLPLSKLPFGVIRGLAFPRQQYVIVAVFLIVCVAVVDMPFAKWFMFVLLGVIAAQLVYILKFSPLWRKQVPEADGDLRRQTDRHISILSANVKMSNRQYAKLIDLAKRQCADFILAIETDAPWSAALMAGLGDLYPHTICRPQDNGYGLCVLSRLALSEIVVHELVTQDVPSIEVVVALPDGSAVKVFVLHPEPPVVNHDTIGRDSEIALIGLRAKACTLPAIVAGDLNDVAWSTTTRRFQRLSGLLDPRVGRGFYNTFHAYVPIWRWPLDHLFHDARFRLVKLERLSHIGSDHFPMLFSLALAQTEVRHERVGSAAPKEKKAVKNMIKKEQDRNRAPIGEDWEDD